MPLAKHLSGFVLLVGLITAASVGDIALNGELSDEELDTIRATGVVQSLSFTKEINKIVTIREHRPGPPGKPPVDIITVRETHILVSR